MEQIIRRLQAIRECGHVERAHNVLHHGSYNNAAHSWQLVVLILVLHPAPPARLILAAILHDVPERWTGDFPGSFKAWIASPVLKAEIAKVESTIVNELDLSHWFDGLPQDEKIWLKSCDMLEAWLWCKDQESLGNKHTGDMKDNIQNWFDQHYDIIPAPVRRFKGAYYWQRTSDIDGFKKI